MRSTIPILICCLYALSAVDATPFSKRGSAEVQQGNAKAAKPLEFGDDKSDDDDKDDKDGNWSKDDHYGKGSHDGGNGLDDCASRSISVLIGTTTFAIPCLPGGNIVNLNGLLPPSTVTSSVVSSSATEASSSAVSSSAVDSSSSAASSSEASSATDSTTTTDTTTTTSGHAVVHSNIT